MNKKKISYGYVVVTTSDFPRNVTVSELAHSKYEANKYLNKMYKKHCHSARLWVEDGDFEELVGERFDENKGYFVLVSRGDLFGGWWGYIKEVYVRM